MQSQPKKLFPSATLILFLFAGASCQTAPTAAPPSAGFKGETRSAAVPTAKSLYREMSDDEKLRFVSSEADKILQIVGGGSESEISPTGKTMIKNFVDAYAKRQTDNSAAMNFCDSKNWIESNLTAIFQRGAKAAPAIAAAFEKEGLAPHVGVYTAMIESEFCPCLQSPTGPAGYFKFTRAIAMEAGLKVVAAGEAVNETDDRCRLEPASRSAAAFFKMTAKRITDEPNRTTLAIAAWNSGVGSLNKNMQTVKAANGDAPVSFWTLLENRDKLTSQFQSENSKYVPKFFAAAIVGENPAVFGVEAAPLSAQTKTAVSKPRQADAADSSAPPPTLEFWQAQRRKALEPRGAETGEKAAGLKVPAELESSPAKQVRKIRELGLPLPKDFAETAEMLRGGKLTIVQIAAADYFLDAGGSAADAPFASFNPQTSAANPLEPERLRRLREFAGNLDGRKYDLDNSADRRQLRIRLLNTLAPEAKTVLEETARAYRERFARPLRASSLMRPLEYQFELSKSDANFSRSPMPPHSTGLAFDVACQHLTAEEQNFLMETLAELERAGKLDAARETERAVLHVFVYPDGKPPQP